MMPEFTKVTWSEPSRRERPMQGFWPHSVQKRYLGSTEKHTVSFMCFSLLFFFARFAHRRQNKYNCNNNKKNLKCGQKSHGLPFLRMDGDGPRLIQSFRYDHWAVRTIQTGNFDEIETVVCPIQVSWWTDGGKKAITGWANTSFIDPHEHQTCEGYARTHIVKLIRRFSQTNPRKTIRLMMHKSFFQVLTGLKQQQWNKTTCTLSDKMNQFTRKKIITACYWIALKQENSMIHLLSFAPLIERHML